MKTLTCKQLGGTCDFEMSADTEKEMKDKAWKHVAEAHRERFETTKKMMDNATPEQKDQSDAYFHKIWEDTPEKDN